MDKTYYTMELLIALTFFVLGMTLGSRIQNAHMSNGLIESGHAEYYLDDDHNRQFIMKECE